MVFYDFKIKIVSFFIMNTEYQNTCNKNMTLFKNRILFVVLYYTIMLNLICDI